MEAKFPQEFRRLAELSAIARITSYEESVRELILQAIVVCSDSPVQNASELREAIEVYFNIHLDTGTVENALEFLGNGDSVRTDLYGNLALSEAEEQRRRQRIQKSHELETQIYSEWESEVRERIKGVLAFSDLRKCFQAYLAAAFRIHGVETAKILDPESEVAEQETIGLQRVLNEVVATTFGSGERAKLASELVAEFFKAVSQFEGRRAFLIELADGTFSFFSFYIDPSIKERLSQNLERLEFFLDTNFLWGVLGLHDNQYVESSVQILETAQQKGLPFKFKYHSITEEELVRSVASAGKALRARDWTRSVSQSIQNNPHISGIEREYHTKNAKSGTDVGFFLKRFENIARSLGDMGIVVDKREIDWDTDSNEIFHAYKEYLEYREKEKSDDAIQHDARLLTLARKMRNTNRSPLLAGVLFLTCDKNLFNFDVKQARESGAKPATIIPNVLLQILRPLLSEAENFEELFVKTFSLPEFRSFSKKASLAVHKMAQILTATEGMDLKLAEQLLMDEILVHEVEGAKGEEAIKVILEERIAREASALRKKIEVLADEKDDSLSEFIRLRDMIGIQEAEHAKKVAILKRQLEDNERQRREEAEADRRKHEAEKGEIEKRLVAVEDSSERIEKSLNTSKGVICVLLSILISLVFYVYILPGGGSGGVSQALLMLISMVTGSFAIRYRKSCPSVAKWCAGGSLTSLVAFLSTRPW